MQNLRRRTPGQWYSCLKQITFHDQLKNDKPSEGEVSHLPDQEQVELITNQFAKVPNIYQPFKNTDISDPHFKETEIPKFTCAQVWFTLIKINTNKTTVSRTFTAKLIKLFAAYLAEPFTDILNTSIDRGEYPESNPKSHPTEKLAQLRNISGPLNFDKQLDKLLAEL